MDIETSKNDNNLDELYEEDNFEMNSEIIEEKTTPENYSTDEYNNIIMYDSDIDDCYRSFEEDLNEESRCNKNNYENFNECDEDIDSQKEDYDEGFKDGYEKGARDAFGNNKKMKCNYFCLLKVNNINKRYNYKR